MSMRSCFQIIFLIALLCCLPRSEENYIAQDISEMSDTNSEPSSDSTGSPLSSPRILAIPACSPASPLTSPTVQATPRSSDNVQSSATSHSDSSSEPSPKRRKTKVCRTTVKRKLYPQRSSSEDECVEATETGSSSVTSFAAEANLDQPAATSSVADADQYGIGYHPSMSGFFSDARSDSENSDISLISESSSSSSSSSAEDNSDFVGSASDYDSNEESDSNSDRNETQSDSDSDSEEINYLWPGSDMTGDEGLLQVLKIFINNRWTKKSLDDVIKMLKRMLPDPNEMPTSGKVALNRVLKLTASSIEVEFLYCDNCLRLWNLNSPKCLHCSGEDIGKFYYLPLEEQIRHMFEHRNLADVVDSHRNNAKRQEGYICDITDGSLYIKVRQKLNGDYDLVILWNTDGIGLSGSSNVELWPVLGTICEVPPRLRSSYLLVFGVYVGKQKPDMNVFLKPFADSLIKVWDSKLSWVHPSTKVRHSSVIVAPILCADAPARAQVQNMIKYNGRFGCNTCEQKSKKTNQPIEVRNKKNEIVLRRKRVFLFQETSAPLRKGPRMDLQGELAEERNKSRKGVNGPAVVSKIPLFDRAKCICAEYLHLVCLGVVKSLLNLFFFTPGPWYIGDKVDEMDEFISTISVPDFVKRLPRGIDKFKHWKASEFRSFLLFYSCPLFKDRLPDNYFQHWLLLVQAMFILLQEQISHAELKSADIMLRSFVRDIKTLFGENTYTYNLHTLLHVCTLVKRWGPIWATAAFIFENFNGFISSHLHGTKHLAKELIINIRIAMGVTLMENMVNGPSVFGSRNQDTRVLSNPFNIQNLSNSVKLFINNNNFGQFLLHDRVKIRGEVYTAKPYDDGKRRANSYIKFEQENQSLYGQVCVYVKDETGMFAIVCILKIDSVNYFIHSEGRFVVKNLKPFMYTETLVMIPVESIKTKVLKIGMYLGIRPNTLEINL